MPAVILKMWDFGCCCAAEQLGKLPVESSQTSINAADVFSEGLDKFPKSSIEESTASSKGSFSDTDLNQVKSVQDTPLSSPRMQREPRETFIVSMEHTASSSLGIDVSAIGNVCMVENVRPGCLIAQWNEKCPEDSRVIRSDRIVSVNGQWLCSAPELTSALLAARRGPVEIILQRGHCFEAVVKKEPQKALGFSIKEGADFLIVLEVFDEGCVQAYNRAVPDQKEAIVASCRILRVNGESGSGSQLIELARNASDCVRLDVISWGAI